MGLLAESRGFRKDVLRNTLIGNKHVTRRFLLETRDRSIKTPDNAQILNLECILHEDSDKKGTVAYISPTPSFFRTTKTKSAPAPQ
jgi:hypothetical protein